MPGRRAADRAGEELSAADSEPAGARRWAAIGDAQAPTERFLAILAARGITDARGRVAAGVHLISAGDHFDYPPPPHASGHDVGGNGCAILRWLAEQPPERATILLGNHDAARVIELVACGDESFAAARELAERIARSPEASPQQEALRAEFLRRFSAIPTPDLARRDFSSYSTAQRDLVRELLLAGRMQLAVAARLAAFADLPVLVTHAGVTARELAFLDLARPDPAAIARALNAFLAAAVARVRDAWQRGEPEPLDLAPLHVAGRGGEEGGGLLYHRPAAPPEAGSPALPTAGDAWRFHPERPRRFDPRALPRGLVQACGHTGHEKLREDLGDWAGADEPGAAQSIRLLAVRGDRVRYGRWDGGRPPAGADEASLLLLDAGMHRADPESFPVLELLPPDGS